MTWSAQQYLAFENARNRPIRDLLAALPTGRARSVIDLGCGPGNSTELLAARFSDAEVTGVDSSGDMLRAARSRLPAVRFELCSIENWLSRDGSFDAILANAVLHWLPDHGELFPALLAKLRPGGSLGVQVPDNWDEPAVRLMRETASSGPWAAAQMGALSERRQLESPVFYHELMRRLDCQVEVWRTTYYHHLAGGPNAIVEWFEGSSLRPFLAPLVESRRQEFLLEYRQAVAAAYPSQTDGSVILPFPRLFIVATAAG